METPLILWSAMLAYGAVMWLVSPRATTPGQFFGGRRHDGSETGGVLLVASVVVSWIFAKSITNAANLGHSYGLVGVVAYAGWYVSIPVAGVVLYLLRTRSGARSLPEWVARRYGRVAAWAFLAVVLVRLMNEIWSNTAVVGAYFGAAGSTPYLMAASIFALLTLAYSLRGGLRSSILTDVVQLGLAVFLLVFVLALLVPGAGAATLVRSGEWTLAGGVDLLLVALLQSFSYPFHDPVLTDRGFITRPRVMLKGFLLAGVLAAAFIVLFGLVGVYGKVLGLDAGQDAPLRVAQAFGVAFMAAMSVLMMLSAGSTLDSTLSSFAKGTVHDLGTPRGDQRSSGRLARWLAGHDPVRLGRAVMVAAVVLGSVPLFAGVAILKATTVSGTMVIGLAPVFLLAFVRQAGPAAFHLAFWPGVILGVLHAAALVPSEWAIGSGPYAPLLGANAWGTAVVFAGFGVGATVDRFGARAVLAVAAPLVALLLGWSGLARGASGPPSRDDPEPPPPKSAEPALQLGGEMMLRYTTKLDDLERPAAEIYTVRLRARAAVDPVRFLAELRFRQSSLRGFSPSNVWLQQAWAAWDTPTEGLTLSAGLLYDQLGLFWDGSWFGNLPYLNGHKLDPDLNVELKLDRELSEAVSIRAWIQGSPSEDGLNGQFSTARRPERLLLPPDPEVTDLYREALAVRARVVPTFRLGELELAPGGSVQYSVYDRSASEDAGEATGSQLVGGAELSASFREVRVFSEVLVERIRDLSPETLERTYLVAGAEATLLRGTGGPVEEVLVGLSWQRATYEPEDLQEWFLTARAYARLHPMIGVTVEYVRWQLEEASSPELNRVETILHVYY